MDVEQVREFISKHAQAALLEKRLKELRGILLPQLRAGEPSPPELPFLLERSVQNRTVKDYRPILMKILAAVLGKPGAEQKMASIEARFRKNPVEELSVVQNKALAAGGGLVGVPPAASGESIPAAAVA